MRIYSCVVVDDQASAQRILAGYIAQTPNLRLAATFMNPLKCISYLEEELVDILFLDVQLPQLSGIEMYNALVEKPHVVLTTAFSEYAVLGFELDIARLPFEAFFVRSVFEKYFQSATERA